MVCAGSISYCSGYGPCRTEIALKQKILKQTGNVSPKNKLTKTNKTKAKTKKPTKQQQQKAKQSKPNQT